MHVVWAIPAINDLAAIRAYVANDRPDAALRLVATIHKAALNLRDFPYLGRTGRRPGTRELVVAGTPYIIAYRVAADTLTILRVLHGRQRWPQLE